eukprot:7817488-Ditylum_brightwellii.AAC.1
MVFPNNIANETELACPTDWELQGKLQSQPTNWATSTAKIMQIALLPAFLLYDGLEADLQTEELYEWVLSLDNQAEDYITHAQNFLCACLVKRNINNPKTFVDPAVFMSTAPSVAKRWAKAKFKAIYPVLTQILAQITRT